MSPRSFIKQHKGLTLLIIAFLAWMAFLISILVLGTRQVMFLDYITNADVSKSYASEIPLFRYIIEPIVGVAYYFTIRDYYFPIAVLMGFLIFRILYGTLKRKDLIKSEKALTLAYMARDFMGFTIKVIGVVIAIIASFYLLGFFLLGGLIGLLYRVVLILAFGVGALLMLIKLSFMLFRFIQPYLKFNYRMKHSGKSPKNKLVATMKKELVYVLGFALIFSTANVLLFSVQLPTQRITTDLEEGEILMDFHAHTHVSDGWLSPIERVNWYMEHGIQVAAFSDHHTTLGAKMAKNYVDQNDLEFTVIIAQEYTTSYGIHLNIYGIEEDIVPIEYEKLGGPKSMTTEEMIKHVKANGGYVIVNHYNNQENDIIGGLGMPYNYTELMEWGVDGFEIINEGDLYPNEIREFCLKNGLACISSTDMHLNGEARAFMKIKLNSPDDINLEDLFLELKKNTHQAVLIDLEPDRVKFPGFLANFQEMEHFLNYLLNLDDYQCLSWMAWSLGAFSMFFFLYRRIEKLNLEELKKKII